MHLNFLELNTGVVLQKFVKVKENIALVINGDMMSKSKRTKACDIPMSVKKKVWERDNFCCCVCGTPNAMPNVHFLPRSKGGLGIEQNIVTLCMQCHFNYDQTTQREVMGKFIKKYLNEKYDNWDEESLVYKRW